MWQPQTKTIPGKPCDRRNRSGFDPKSRSNNPKAGSGRWTHPYDPDFAPHPRLGGSWGLGTLIFTLLSAVWFLITLPFRLLFGAISLMGRLVGVGIGFTLMVVGMALLAGPFFLIGLPMFLVGLFLTMRSLG